MEVGVGGGESIGILARRHQVHLADRGAQRLEMRAPVALCAARRARRAGLERDARLDQIVDALGW